MTSLSDNIDDKHKHTYEDQEVKSPLRDTENEGGKHRPGIITAVDSLKQRVCVDCGHTVTYDLERKKA